MVKEKKVRTEYMAFYDIYLCVNVQVYSAMYTLIYKYSLHMRTQLKFIFVCKIWQQLRVLFVKLLAT